MLLAYRGELAEGSGAYAERRLRRRGCGASAVLSTPRRRRRGVGRACRLAALLYAGGYGYDMRKAILERTNGEVDVDVGGLYRSLRRLEGRRCGGISMVRRGRWAGRRREYELTQQGVELAEQWLDALRARRRSMICCRVAGRRLGGAETKRRLKYYPDLNERRARWARR